MRWVIVFIVRTDCFNSVFLHAKTIRFLEDGACKTQTKENIVEFLREVSPFNLTKNECLMMVNDPPTSALHIQLQVEDSEERLSDEQVNRIIEIAQRRLLPSVEE